MYCPILTLVIITSCSMCHLIMKVKTDITRAVAKLVSLQLIFMKTCPGHISLKMNEMK